MDSRVNVSLDSTGKDNGSLSVQNQLEILDTVAKWTDDHFHICADDPKFDRTDDRNGDTEEVDNTFIVKQIQKTLKPKSRRDRKCADSPGRASTSLSGLSRYRRDEREGFCSVEEINRRASMEELPCPDTETNSFDTLDRVIQEYTNFDARDDFSSGNEQGAIIIPKSPVRHDNQSIRSKTDSGQKKTRFAEVLEEEHFLPLQNELEEAPSGLLSCISRGFSGRWTKRPSTQCIDRCYNKSKSTNSDDMSDTMEERSVATATSEDQSYSSSELSVGDLSLNSVGSVELLLNHLFCSTEDRVTSSDWIR